MPRTPPQVDALLDQVRGIRDDLNTQIESDAATLEANGDAVNAARLRSLKLDAEVARDAEVTTALRIDQDDRGNVRGAVKVTLPIEDVDGSEGLRSMFANDRAAVDVDGDLTIDGRKHSRRP